ncbi:PGM2, partial [Symbiodinium microadriaticum]
EWKVFSGNEIGFKWIGNRARELQQEGFKVLFLYEEALGYCVGDVVVDKDGISAAVAMAELANNLAMEGLTLTSQLAALHAKYGLYVSYNTYLFVPDPAVTSLIFERLRG